MNDTPRTDYEALLIARQERDDALASVAAMAESASVQHERLAVAERELAEALSGTISYKRVLYECPPAVRDAWNEVQFQKMRDEEYAMGCRGLLSEAMVALHHVYMGAGMPVGMRPLLDKIDAALAKNPPFAEPSVSTQAPAGTTESAPNPGHLSDDALTVPLRTALENLLAQVVKFCEEHGEADFYTGEACDALRADDARTVKLPEGEA